MLRRAYGSTGEELSIIGFGGIVAASVEQATADRLVRGAIDRGVNYFDVAPTYADAEDRIGPALKGLRDGVFLACKTEKRTKADAAIALRTSLSKLQTDRFDLYQLHGLQNLADAEACLAPDGALAAIVEAREAGLVRYIGFSSHSVAAALRCLEAFPFDSVLFPFNVTAFVHADMGPQVLRDAAGRNVARLALKALAQEPWPEGAERPQPKCWYRPFTDRSAAADALRWTLSLPITAAIPPGDPEVFEMALDIAAEFEPLTDHERERIEVESGRRAPLFKSDA